MKTNWPNKYYGREYSDEYDCARLVEEVYKNEFGKELILPHNTIYSSALTENYTTGFTRIITPVEGDIVLMSVIGRLHLGIYFLINDAGHV